MTSLVLIGAGVLFVVFAMGFCVGAWWRDKKEHEDRLTEALKSVRDE